LRERAGDILPLARHFLHMYAQRLHVADPVVTPEADHALLAYPWPGNIRELENVIHRALLVCQQGVITAADLHLPSWHTQPLATPGAVPPPVPDVAHDAAPPPAAFASRPAAPAAGDAYADLRTAWQQLLQSDRTIEFENMVLQLAEDAWRHNLCNQVRTAKQLNISRNILRTYLKKSNLL
jgi:sigma-54-specific transcriptional regulator